MMKINNKPVINKIALTTYKANKKRNLLIIFAIFLSTFLIASIISVGTSYWKTTMERQLYTSGIDYDIALTEPEDAQIQKARSIEEIKYAGLLVKCAVIEKYQQKMPGKTRLYWADNTCFDKMVLPALETFTGTYPEKENEILLSSRTLQNMGIKKPHKGMKLELSYYTLEEGTDEEILEKEFILCGWYNDYTGKSKGYISEKFYKKSNVKPTDFTQGSLKIKLKQPLYTEKDILSLQNTLNLSNRQIIEADASIISYFIKITAGLAGILFMVFASSYLFIYNTLYISVTRDIRYYGQLKTIGMTSVQLKKLINKQAFWNALAGIPAGLVVAIMLSKIIIPEIISIIDYSFNKNNTVPVNIWSFLIAGIFAIAAIKASSHKPARIAADCSPVEALIYTGISAKRKNRKRESTSIFSMAMQNIFRNKKQAFIIFLSFVTAISVYLCTSIYIRANDAKYILNEVLDYDIRFQNETTLEEEKPIFTKEKIKQLEKLPGIKSVRTVSSKEVIIPYQEETLGKYFKELYSTRYFPAGSYESDMAEYKKNPGNGIFTSRFIGIDEAGFEYLNKSVGNTLDRNDFEAGRTAVAIRTFTEGDSGMTGKTINFRLPGGLNPEKEYSVKIAAVASIQSNPAFFAGGIAPEIIVSEKFAEKLLGETYIEAVMAEYKEPYNKETENAALSVFNGITETSSESRLCNYNEMKTTENKSKVLGNSISIIMAILAIFNYLDMMASNVHNRSKELATLESIGMTSKQAKRMLGTEGLGYAIISVTISLAAGIPLSYAVFNAINLYAGVSYSIPLGRNIIFFAIITIICVTVPVIVYKKTQNQGLTSRMGENF
ncbi:MAG: ABC transporter permease [Lachnospiraceae bacterium]|nr:ABC transporter permease [Lachnospiraceae bacterium]